VEPGRAPAVQRDLDELARPALTSQEVIVELIGATTTHTGLRVRAKLDRGRYPLGVKVRDQELAAVPLARHEFHGEWNYTIQRAQPAASTTYTIWQSSSMATAPRCCCPPRCSW
jgi:hypothetical protein